MLFVTFLDPNEVNTSSLSEQFEREGVMITIEWTQQSSLVSFLVSVHPEVAIQLNISNSVTASAQLVIPYNTVQNVSISAAVLCGLSSMTTIMLNYGEFQVY